MGWYRNLKKYQKFGVHKQSKEGTSKTSWGICKNKKTGGKGS